MAEQRREVKRREVVVIGTVERSELNEVGISTAKVMQSESKDLGMVVILEQILRLVLEQFVRTKIDRFDLQSASNTSKAREIRAGGFSCLILLLLLCLHKRESWSTRRLTVKSKAK